MSNVRIPPRRPFEHLGWKGCPMCGEKAGGRRRWHPECAQLWNLAADPQIQSRHLRALHGEKCWECGRKTYCEVEHRRPLWSLEDHERKELKWWLPFNLQLMCRPCHLRKSSKETTERAVRNRSQASLMGKSS